MRQEDAHANASNNSAYAEPIEPYQGSNLSSRFAADRKLTDSARHAELKFLVDNYRAIQWSQYLAWRAKAGR